MTKELDMPETIGELVELLSKYPKNTKLAVFVTEFYDNASTGISESYKLEVQDDWPNDTIFLTFGNGWTLA